MIASADRLRAQALHDRFLTMLPQIRAQARVAFGGKSPERREELIAEVFAKKTQTTSKKVIDTCKGRYKGYDDACK